MKKRVLSNRPSSPAGSDTGGATRPLQSARFSPTLQYGIAVACVGLATAVRFALDRALGDHLPFAVYLLAVAVVAWLTRLGPSVAALILGAFAGNFFFVRPRYSYTLDFGPSASETGLVLYLASSVVIVAICEAWRRAACRADLRTHQLEITLASIGDGVIATDQEGRVTSLNPVAESLTKLKESEAKGRPLEEVFRIINETTRQPIENLLTRVLEAGTIVGMGNHTILVARDGAERPIDNSAAPIRGTSGEVAGVVLVFRDVSERRRAEKERFQLAAIVESSEDAIIGKDLNGVITSWNRGAENLYGYSAAEVIGKSISIIFPPERRNELSGILQRLKRGERIEHYETIRVRKNGDRIRVSVTISPVLDDAGRIIGASAIARDITERARAEEALRESEQRSVALVRGAIDGIITVDEGGKILDFNPAAEQIFRYRREEALGRNLSDLIAARREADQSGILQRSAARAGPPRRLETSGVRADGSQFPIEVAITKIGEQKPALFAYYVRDISERKRNEDHLKFLARAGELFASSLDFDTTITNIVKLAVPTLADWAVVDLANRDGEEPYRRLAVVHVDPAKCDLAMELRRKYPPDPAKDRVLQAIRTGRSELVSDVSEEMLRAVSRNDEHFAILKELGLVSWMIVPLRFRDVAIGAVTFVSADSKRRFTTIDLANAEEFARQASTAFENSRLYSEAQQANRAKDNFLATLSHELRTPMTSILGWARMLAGADLDDQTRAMAVESIQRSATLQAELIEDVLDMSRIASGKMRLDVQMCDLSEIVQAALGTVEPAAAAKGITIHLEKSGTNVVTADPKRLQQVIWNLLTNGIKFTPRGGEIRVRLEQTDSAAQVTVTDNGQGFAPEFGHLIFEPFRQAESSTTRTHGGLGLGLSIVRYLVEQHGGVVTAESPGPGRGATFRVRLPLRALLVDERTADISPIRLATGGRSDPPCTNDELGHMRILFVDDQEDARNLFRTILQRCGAFVTVTQSVDGAIKHFEQESFDVVVTDIAMPERDGFELIEWLNRRPDRSTFSIVALTAFGGRDDHEKIREAGCDAYLKKPVEPAELITTVASISEQRAAHFPRGTEGA